jgi:hypothetical protein
MTPPVVHPSVRELYEALASGLPALPELALGAKNRLVLEWTGHAIERAYPIPTPTFTAYRRFAGDGDRSEYEKPYFERRQTLAAAAIEYLYGKDDRARTRAIVEDYAWAICEETQWVVPAHEGTPIDLCAAETGLALAELLHVLGGAIGHEVRRRIEREVDERILVPYLRSPRANWWFSGHSNWNGVCNGAIGATFVLLERDPRRATEGVALALEGLEKYFATAFEEDGSSNEGVGYFYYGLTNVVVLSEMLRAKSGGRIDLLASPRVQQIASYPAKVQLSGSQFATFSDCPDSVPMDFGLVLRLAERTQERSLARLMASPAEPEIAGGLSTALRSTLWWDGKRPEPAPIDDAVLPGPGIARLVGRTRENVPYAVVVKAGHNAENHNQNDVGSFIVHVDGESLLCDPGRGRYTRQYFGPERYEHPLVSSYGHGVPRVAGKLQAAGREHRGELVQVRREEDLKSVTVEIARAYPVAELAKATRMIALRPGGALELFDSFEAEGAPIEIEEALVTFSDVSIDARVAVVRGERHQLRMTIARPGEATWSVEPMEQVSRDNDKPRVLKRLRFALAKAEKTTARVAIVIERVV